MAIEEVIAAPGPATTGLEASVAAEERVSVASQWQLMWWRFRMLCTRSWKLSAVRPT